MARAVGRAKVSPVGVLKTQISLMGAPRGSLAAHLLLVLKPLNNKGFWDFNLTVKLVRKRRSHRDATPALPWRSRSSC